MAKKERKENPREFKPRFGLNDNLRNLGIWGAATAAGMVSLSDSSSVVRNIIPEPFDFMDHAGNLAPSMVLGAGATYVAALIGSKFSSSPKAIKIAAAILGMAAVTAANLLVETKYGLSIYDAVNDHTTADVLDIAYGVGIGAFGSNLVKVVPKDEKQDNTDMLEDIWESDSRRLTN